MEECCNEKNDECCDEKNDECCNDEKCCSGAEGEYCEISKMILDLSVDAWEELIIEKMKKAFEAQAGPRMDKIAEIAVAHSSKIWSEKMKAKNMEKEASAEEIEEYKNKIMEAFMG